MSLARNIVIGLSLLSLFHLVEAQQITAAPKLRVRDSPEQCLTEPACTAIESIDTACGSSYANEASKVPWCYCTSNFWQSELECNKCQFSAGPLRSSAYSLYTAELEECSILYSALGSPGAATTAGSGSQPSAGSAGSSASGPSPTVASGSTASAVSGSTASAVGPAATTAKSPATRLTTPGSSIRFFVSIVGMLATMNLLG
jgi:hypothetical protein